MQNPRVLYLSYDGLTDPLGQSQVLPYVVGLSKKGYAFTIISFEKENAFCLGQKGIESICAENTIEWIPLQYHKRPPVLSTLYDVWKLWRKVTNIYQQHGFEIVHCRSYITSLVGLWAKRKWSVKFIFDMRGFWADERVEGGLWNLKNLIFKLVYRFFKKKEKQFLQEANHVVSLTYSAKEEIESWNLKNAPITVIPTCVDLDLFNPKKIMRDDQDYLRSKLGIQGKDFVLLYLGSLGTWYLTNEMLDIFSELKKEKADAKFLIVSSDQINLENYIHKKDVIIATATRNQVPLYISLAHASVCFIKPTFSKKASSATKMGEIMAMNVPLIVNKGWGDIDIMIEKQWGVFDKNVWKLEGFITNKYNPFVKNFSLEMGVMKYQEIYRCLT